MQRKFWELAITNPSRLAIDGPESQKGSDLGVTRETLPEQIWNRRKCVRLTPEIRGAKSERFWFPLIELLG